MLEQIAEGVFVHQSQLLRNNTTVVQGDDGVLLVDPGTSRDELRCLARDLRELGQPVVAGFATHPDWDHVQWYAEFGDVPRYGTARCATFMRELLSKLDWRERAVTMLPPELLDDPPLDGFGRITALPSGGHVPWDGPRIRVVEHRGHAEGHAALVIADRRVLVAGDMLSDLFVPMLDFEGPDPIGDYLDGLRLIEEAAAAADVVVPGHGSVAQGAEIRTRIARDRAYVRALGGDQRFADARVSGPFEPGWEWVSSIHEGQLNVVGPGS